MMCPSHGRLQIKQRNVDVASAELRRKIQLENTFKREIRSIFNTMISDFRVRVSAIGQAPSAEAYQPAWESTLQKQYERVQRAFRGEVLAQNGEKSFRGFCIKQDADQDALESLISLALLQWRVDTAPRQSQEITATSDDEMQFAIVQGRQALIDDGQPVTNAALAVVAAQILRRRSAARVNLIAMTETQQAAEATKQITAEAMNGRRPFPLRGEPIDPTRPSVPPVAEEITKTWDTVGDSRVRQSHRAANGTTIPIDQTFVVEGGRLRFPGDMSLGAPISAWINCRCSARYEV